MGFARTRKGRVKQTEAWLRKNFPTPYPVKVQWHKFIPVVEEDRHLMTKKQLEQGIYAECAQFKRYFMIRLSLRRCRTIAMCIESMHHEWAHASTTRHDKIEAKRQDHDVEYDLEYGRIYRAWHDQGGCEESGAFPWK